MEFRAHLPGVAHVCGDVAQVEVRGYERLQTRWPLCALVPWEWGRGVDVGRPGASGGSGEGTRSVDMLASLLSEVRGVRTLDGLTGYGS
jgi:hypothetical protein